MSKEISYKGTDLVDIYALALIGADFSTEKKENGVMVVNSLNKHLYTKTVLLSRFLKVVELPEDRVMSLEQYKANNIGISDFEGKDVGKLKEDFEVFKDMLDTEIKNIIACNNDIVNRINESISMDMTPEKIENLKKQQDELMEELNKVK